MVCAYKPGIQVIDMAYKSRVFEELNTASTGEAPANYRVMRGYKATLALLGLGAILAGGCGSEPSPPNEDYKPAAVQPDNNVQRKQFNIFNMDRRPLRMGDFSLDDNESVKEALKNFNDNNGKPIDKHDYNTDDK